MRHRESNSSEIDKTNDSAEDAKAIGETENAEAMCEPDSTESAETMDDSESAEKPATKPKRTRKAPVKDKEKSAKRAPGKLAEKEKPKRTKKEEVKNTGRGEVKSDEYRLLRDTIYTFFYYKNKPVGVTEIGLQFKSAKKAMIEAILEDLVDKGKIVCKTIKRLTVYYLTQDMAYTIDEDEYTDKIDAAQDQTIEDKTLRYLAWRHNKTVEKLSERKKEHKMLSDKLLIYRNQMTAEELRHALENMGKTIAHHEMQEKVETVSAEEMKRAVDENALLKKQAIERKKLWNEILNSLSEGMGMSKSVLLENAGVE